MYNCLIFIVQGNGNLCALILLIHKVTYHSQRVIMDHFSQSYSFLEDITGCISVTVYLADIFNRIHTCLIFTIGTSHIQHHYIIDMQ